MADIFDEVSEELKQDQLVQVWKKYSKHIIIILSILILSSISYFLYGQWYQKKLENISTNFFSAVQKLEKTNYLDSSKDFSKNLSQDHNGYIMLSLFGLAETNFKTGKINEMITNYKTIYENQNIDQYYRDLSRLLSVMKDNVSSFENRIEILRPILNSPSKLQLLAAELKILLLLNKNKIDDAKISIEKLLNRSDITLDQASRLRLIKKVYETNVN